MHNVNQAAWGNFGAGMTWLAVAVIFGRKGICPGEHLDAEALAARAEGGEPEPESPRVLAGTVHAVLRPHGLIEVGGLIGRLGGRATSRTQYTIPRSRWNGHPAGLAGSRHRSAQLIMIPACPRHSPGYRSDDL